MKKFIMTVAIAGFLALAGSASALSNYGGYYLKVGTPGPDANVMTLQQCLIDEGYSNSYGVDGYFGNITDSQVRAYQFAKNVKKDGIVGPDTWAVLDCEPDTEVEPTPEPEETIIIGNDGDEVSFSEYDVDDASDDTLEEGEEGVELGSIEFENEDSDVLLERLDVILGFQGTNDGDEKDAYQVFDKIYIEIDGKEVASINADDRDDWKDRTVAGLTETDDNRLRISGINEVLAKDEKHTVTILADIASSVDLGSNNVSEWALAVDQSTLRFVDEAGITSYLSEEDGNNVKFADFTIEEEGGDDELKVVTSSEDPASTTFDIDDSEKSDEEMIFAFKMEADEDGGDLDIDNLYFEVTLTDPAGNLAASTFNDIVDEIVVKLDGNSEDAIVVDYDHNTAGPIATIGSATPVAINAGAKTALLKVEFDNDVTIKNGKDEVVEVYATFKSNTNYDDGVKIKVVVTGKDVDAFTIEGAEDLAAGQLKGSATGEEHTLLLENALISVESSAIALSDTADATVDDKATVTFGVKVTSEDETVYIPKAAAAAFVMNIVNASSGTAIAMTDIAVIGNLTNLVTLYGTEYYEVSGDMTFDFVGTAETATPSPAAFAAGLTYGELVSVDFGTDNGVTVDMSTVTVTDEKTSTVSVN